MIPLNAATRERLEALFREEDRAAAVRLLEERCGDNLPLTDRADEDFWNRIRFAVLKLSEGDLGKLQRAVQVANEDWRDTLVAAGFGHSVTIHRTWFPSRE